MTWLAVLLSGRSGVAILAVLIAALIGLLIYWQGGSDARRDARELRDHISTTERMRDADPDFSDGCGWFERLHARCE